MRIQRNFVMVLTLVIPSLVFAQQMGLVPQGGATPTAPTTASTGEKSAAPAGTPSIPTSGSIASPFDLDQSCPFMPPKGGVADTFRDQLNSISANAASMAANGCPAMAQDQMTALKDYFLRVSTLEGITLSEQVWMDTDSGLMGGGSMGVQLNCLNYKQAIEAQMLRASRVLADGSISDQEADLTSTPFVSCSDAACVQTKGVRTLAHLERYCSRQIDPSGPNLDAQARLAQSAETAVGTLFGMASDPRCTSASSGIAFVQQVASLAGGISDTAGMAFPGIGFGASLGIGLFGKSIEFFEKLPQQKIMASTRRYVNEQGFSNVGCLYLEMQDNYVGCAARGVLGAPKGIGEFPRGPLEVCIQTYRDSSMASLSAIWDAVGKVKVTADVEPAKDQAFRADMDQRRIAQELFDAASDPISKKPLQIFIEENGDWKLKAVKPEEYFRVVAEKLRGSGCANTDRECKLLTEDSAGLPALSRALGQMGSENPAEGLRNAARVLDGLEEQYNGTLNFERINELYLRAMDRSRFGENAEKSFGLYNGLLALDYRDREKQMQLERARIQEAQGSVHERKAMDMVGKLALEKFNQSIKGELAVARKKARDIAAEGVTAPNRRNDASRGLDETVGGLYMKCHLLQGAARSLTFSSSTANQEPSWYKSKCSGLLSCVPFSRDTVPPYEDISANLDHVCSRSRNAKADYQLLKDRFLADPQSKVCGGMTLLEALGTSDSESD